MSSAQVKKLISDFESTGKFTVQEVNLTPTEVGEWVEFVVDPKRFVPSIFEGNWARLDRHPRAGAIRLLRIVSGHDQISRVIGRQENRIFAFPWFK